METFNFPVVIFCLHQLYVHINSPNSEATQKGAESSQVQMSEFACFPTAGLCGNQISERIGYQRKGGKYDLCFRTFPDFSNNVVSLANTTLNFEGDYCFCYTNAKLYQTKTTFCSEMCGR